MRDVSIDPTGKFFVVVTTGSYRSGQMCDTASRWEFKGNGANHVPTWVNYTGGDTMTAVEVTGPIAYLGGHFRWLNNPFRGDAAGAGAWSAAGQVGGSDGHGANTGGLAAIDTRNGLPFSWHPGRDRGLGVFDFDSTGEMLWAVSDTNNWAGEFRPRVAGFPYDGGFQVPPDEIGHLPGDVWMLGKLSGPNADQQSAVGFDGTTVSGSLTEAGAQPWGSSRGAFMVDNKVYTGWSDGTFTVQTFDGTTFGTPKTIDLAEGTPTTPGYGSNFINDLPTITGMFYDPVRARIYYTMEGSSSLFWRPFQTESRVVGAARRTLPKATALNPSKVRGMFLAGNQLYFGDNTTGVLKKVTFAGNRITGTASVANSSIDWRARGLFLSAAPSVVGPNYDPTAAFSVTCTGLTCNVDASNSADPDGVIASYDWDFGDGQMGSGKTAQNTYAADGPYNITLTVTDNRGSQATKIRPVNVAAPPNQDPTAAFTVSCFGLDCTVNANGSSDLDGTIDAYDWDFGDLQTGTGKNTNHVYGNPGDYTITLTVTDNRGGTDQVSHDVSPIEIGTTIAFRDASTATGAPTSGPSVNIPGQTQVGDLMLMFATNGNDRTADTPNGWNLLGAQSDSELKTQVFWRFATVADLGTSEQVRFKDANNVNAAAPYTLTVASYAGVDSPPVSDFASLDEPSTVSTNDHVSPDINVPADGDWVVSYWADRTAVGATTTPTTIWTAPNNQATRADVYSSSVSDLRVSSLLTDDDGPALNGARSGKTASTDADTRKATTWTIVLATQ
jgi:PKD repeat protein